LSVFLCSSIRCCDIRYLLRRDRIRLSSCFYFAAHSILSGPTHVFESAMADGQQNQNYCRKPRLSQ
jgi:hypothetical protein